MKPFRRSSRVIAWIIARTIGEERGLELTLRALRWMDPGDCVRVCADLQREAQPEKEDMIARVLMRVFPVTPWP